MVKLDIRVDVNPLRTVKRLVDNDRVSLYVANSAYKLMDKYVPFDTGMLAHTVEITPSKIHYKSSHAARCYFGEHMNFSKEKHKLATARWDEAMIKAYGGQLARQIENYIRRGQV